jgi:hypothetical protein
MNHLEAALLEVVSFLEGRGTDYMVIGGFAALHWGRQRLTRDLDLTVDVPASELGDFVAALGREFKLLDHEPLEFAKRNHLIRLLTRVSVPVDLMLSVLPYQASAIRRAVGVPVGPRTVRFCTAEDLVIHKLASERAQDLIDVEGIAVRQAGRLDLDYLRPRVQELATGLERPEILEAFAGALARAERAAHG